MPQINFDIEGAQAHGYTDDQIADAIASKANFDAVSARQAGYTNADIVHHLTGRRLPIDMDAVAADARKKVANDTGVLDSVAVGAGRTFDRLAKGAEQIWNSVTGNDKAQAELKDQAARDDREYQPLKDAHPVATGVGESLPAVAIPAGGAAATVGQAALRMGIGAAVMKGAQYGTPEERLKGATVDGAAATVGGVVVPKLVQMGAGAVKAGVRGLAGNITPEALALYDKAKALGIPVNVAQLSDSKFLKTLASSLEQVPFTGGAKAASAQRTAFTNAVSKTFGENVDKITPEVYNAAKKRLGDSFNDLSKRNTLEVTPAFQKQLQGIADEAAATGSDDTQRAVQNILGRLDEQANVSGGNVPAQTSPILGPNGQPIVTAPATSAPSVVKVPGATYQSIDTELGNIIKGGGEKGLYAKRLQSTLRDAMDQSISPADQEAWQTARSQYRNLKAVRDVVAKDMGNGDVPPTALSNALNSTEAGKEAMAMGTRGTLGELSQVGRQFVRDQVPNSATAQRAIAMSILGGSTFGGAHGVTAAASLMAGGATTGRIIQKIMSSPKTVEMLRKQGISMSDLAKMPPSKLVQLVGGTLGETAADQPEEK